MAITLQDKNNHSKIHFYLEDIDMVGIYVVSDDGRVLAQKIIPYSEAMGIQRLINKSVTRFIERTE